MCAFPKLHMKTNHITIVPKFGIGIHILIIRLLKIQTQEKFILEIFDPSYMYM